MNTILCGPAIIIRYITCKNVEKSLKTVRKNRTVQPTRNLILFDTNNRILWFAHAVKLFPRNRISETGFLCRVVWLETKEGLIKADRDF